MSKIILEKAFLLKIKNIYNEISSYLSIEGNTLYVNQKTLPFYEKIRSFIRSYEKAYGIVLTREQVYSLCGIEYNKDYATIQEVKSEMLKVCKNGFIDDLKQDRNAGSAYTKFRVMANSHNISIYDFAVLMTGYRFSEAIIIADYEEYLKNELIKAYPNRNLTGIKRERPDLYEKIRHLVKYIPELETTADAVTYLGFDIDKKPQFNHTNINEEIVIDELCKLFPDRMVKNLTTLNNKLYRSIIALARNNNMFISEWLSSKGFNYITKTNAPRLSQVKVDEEERFKLLTKMRHELLKNYNYNASSEIKKFKIDLEIAKTINEQLTATNSQNLNNIP